MRHRILVRSALAVCLVPFLVGCSDNDPREVLCKAAVAETVGADRSIAWLDVMSEPIHEKMSDSEKPEQVRVEGREYTSRPTDADYIVTIQFDSDADGKPEPGGAACKFKRDEAHGYNASNIRVGDITVDPDTLDRLTNRYFENGLWKSYACGWRRFGEEDC